jgi:hypothetical protein
MRFLLFLTALSPLALASCGAVRPQKPFDLNQVPPPPQYAQMALWAAHPDKDDPADKSPSPLSPNLQAEAGVDVFFLHPTTYTGDLRHQRDWNADLADEKTNRKTDFGSIQYQASLFNGAGRVYAPRYRQAHLHVFFTRKDSLAARQALGVAYEDARAAFLHYLKYWNQGRPFILAGHSQGGLHVMSIIKELIEGKELESQLVAAYIVGWPVRDDYFQRFKPCLSAEQTGCFCTWRTWERDYGRRKAYERNIVCTNPLLWIVTEHEYAPKTLNKGGVVRPFERLYPGITDAEIHKGILLASKPKFKGSFFFRRKNYHIGDLNLYYMNVRENAQARAKAFSRR